MQIAEDAVSGIKAKDLKKMKDGDPAVDKEESKKV